MLCVTDTAIEFCHILERLRSTVTVSRWSTACAYSGDGTCERDLAQGAVVPRTPRMSPLFLFAQRGTKAATYLIVSPRHVPTTQQKALSSSACGTSRRDGSERQFVGHAA